MVRQTDSNRHRPPIQSRLRLEKVSKFPAVDDGEILIVARALKDARRHPRPDKDEFPLGQDLRRWPEIQRRLRYCISIPSFTDVLNVQSMLYRFREQQAAERGLIDTGSMRRPKNITQVDSIPVAEKWRGQVIRQISRAVTKIQDRKCPLPTASPHPLPGTNGLILFSKFIGLPNTRLE